MDRVGCWCHVKNTISSRVYGCTISVIYRLNPLIKAYFLYVTREIDRRKYAVLSSGSPSMDTWLELLIALGSPPNGDFVSSKTLDLDIMLSESSKFNTRTTVPKLPFCILN